MVQGHGPPKVRVWASLGSFCASASSPKGRLGSILESFRCVKVYRPPVLLQHRPPLSQANRIRANAPPPCISSDCSCMREREREMRMARSFADGGGGPRSALWQGRLLLSRVLHRACAPTLHLRVRTARSAFKTEPALEGNEATRMTCRAG